MSGGSFHPDNLLVVSRRLTAGYRYEYSADHVYLVWAKLTPSAGGDVRFVARVISSKDKYAKGDDPVLSVSMAISGTQVVDLQEFETPVAMPHGILVDVLSTGQSEAVLTLAFVRRSHFCDVFTSPETKLAKCWDASPGREGTPIYSGSFSRGSEYNPEFPEDGTQQVEPTDGLIIPVEPLDTTSEEPGGHTVTGGDV